MDVAGTPLMMEKTNSHLHDRRNGVILVASGRHSGTRGSCALVRRSRAERLDVGCGDRGKGLTTKGFSTQNHRVRFFLQTRNLCLSVDDSCNETR
jgi:hypothetical protein